MPTVALRISHTIDAMANVKMPTVTTPYDLGEE